MAGTVNGSKAQEFTEDIKLHEAEEPWKPSFKLKRSSETGHATSVEKKLKRNALSILNKITPEKFELLLKQLKKLDINDEEGSNVLICMLYSKATMEPIYSVTYVKMCKFLAPIKIATTHFKAADFHSLFLQKCLKEFENALQEQSKFTEKLDSLSKSYDREKLEREMWEEQFKIKRSLLGNVKLLGELFNQDMLPKSVMLNCLITLCCDQNEVLLEALCLLLKTAGKELLENKNTVYISEVEKIFQKMLSISDMHLTSTRIRFMILDVIDLKENNWISRREEVIPKTIEEIHREAGLEENLQHIQTNKITTSNRNYTDQVETRSKYLIGKFLEDNDLEPICLYVSSLLPNRVTVFIKTSICQVLEENPQNRDSVGELLFQLVKRKFVKIDQYRDGFSSVIEKCKNLAVDTPLIWNNVGEIMYPLVKNDQHSLQFLKILLEPLVSSNTAEKVVSGVFQCIASKEGSHIARHLWDELKEDINEILSNRFNIDEVISACSLQDDDVQNQLLKLLKNSDENEKICQWIDINLINTSDLNFVHALVSAGIKSATIVSSNECRLDEEKFKKSLSLWSIYISSKKSLELQALYSLQLFVQELQLSKGILKQIFEILHKNEVVETESFKKWEEDVGTSEMESKKLAFESVKPFLFQLKDI